jgi:hypothetical protein
VDAWLVLVRDGKGEAKTEMKFWDAVKQLLDYVFWDIHTGFDSFVEDEDSILRSGQEASEP